MKRSKKSELRLLAEKTFCPKGNEKLPKFLEILCSTDQYIGMNVIYLRIVKKKKKLIRSSRERK